MTPIRPVPDSLTNRVWQGVDSRVRGARQDAGKGALVLANSRKSVREVSASQAGDRGSTPRGGM